MNWSRHPELGDIPPTRKKELEASVIMLIHIFWNDKKICRWRKKHSVFLFISNSRSVNIVPYMNNVFINLISPCKLYNTHFIKISSLYVLNRKMLKNIYIICCIFLIVMFSTFGIFNYFNS